MPRPALDALELEERLDELLWAALSSRRSATPAARAIAGLDREWQEFVLHWVRVLEKSNAECAYQFASNARSAVERLDRPGVEAWIILAMDVYDRSGLYAAMDVFNHVERFTERARAREVGVPLEDVARVLERFVLGLSGRRLRLEAGQDTYTDTETIFLPELAGRFASRDQNFRLYKATAVYLWAQTRFGTWQMEPVQAFAHFRDQGRALTLFQALESLRLDARIARELPGAHRDMMALAAQLGEAAYPPGWEQHARILRRTEATVQDTLELLGRLYDTAPHVPPSLCFHGSLRPDRVAEIMALRLAREKQAFRAALARLHNELVGPAAANEQEGASPFSVRRVPSDDVTEGHAFQLEFEGKPMAPPEDVVGTMESILQDLGNIPDEYLVPAGEGAYYAGSHPGESDPAADVWKGTYHEKGAHLYNEWDFQRQHYRKEWCVLRELDVTPGQPSFVERTRLRYGQHLLHLRKTFEALRGQDKRLKKEPYGDEVDIDALVEARADALTGLEMSERVFSRMHKVERNIAVMFMVDMSGSTKGWINDAERESLVLLCEALESLGDRYAIYGFSGMTRKRCEVYRIKRFNEAYGDEVRARIAGIEPQDYTRMGVAIRHLAKLLGQVEARTRVLITLSDGKPDDYGGEYRGTYGIEDTRRALIEAKRDGIHPFCITIDREGQDYLPHMYGPVNYTVVDAVEKLPYKVSEIYRRLTT